MGNMCVSSCRCCVLVSVVHPVVILSAVFCVICSLLLFVSDASYITRAWVEWLCTWRVLFPHGFDVRALSMCIVLLAFVVLSIHLLYVRLVSRAIPSIFGLMFIGNMVLICSASWVLYSTGSGV